MKLDKLTIHKDSFDGFKKKLLDADEIIFLLDTIIKLEQSKNENKIPAIQVLCEKARELIENG